MTKPVLSNLKCVRAINKAKAFWKKVAKNNGWSMNGRFVTVWVYSDGTIEDSIYSPEKDKMDTVILLDECGLEKDRVCCKRKGVKNEKIRRA